jgi:photosystem II stability/assembly factor-like uncharacterized protein
MKILQNSKVYMMILFIAFLMGCSATTVNDTKGTASATPPTVTATAAINSESPTPSPEVSQKVPMDKVTAVRLASPESGWVGGNGWIARTDTGGKAWKIQYAGAGTIHQIFALDAEHAWASIEEDMSLISTVDGGKSWSKTGNVPNLGFLHFVSLTEGFSANGMTVDGGKTWTKLAVPDKIVDDAYYHDKDHGWAVTQSEKAFQIERTTDGGKTWKIVMSRKSESSLNGALIRSAGLNDAWVEWIGDSGMTQTSYSVFHTSDGGSHWQTVIANSTAGGGPAPGFPSNYTDGPTNQGSSPGPLYVVDPKTAFMGGQCMACDKPNSVGWTLDGGKTWVNGKQTFTGFDAELLAMADAKQGWLICTDVVDASVMYMTSDGGVLWKKVHTFATPKKAA